MSGVNMDSSYRTMIDEAGKQVGDATSAGNNLVNTLNHQGFQLNGKALGPFNNLADWQKALSQPGVTSTMGSNAAAQLGAVNDAMGRLANAKALVEGLKAGLSEQMTSVNAMLKLLQSGDIEGAVMMLQTSRAKVLEQQLGTRIEGMQARNAQIKNLNDQLKVKQGELAGVTGTDAAKQAARDRINSDITGLKGDMDKLNSDSQLDMIGIQGLVNKRNEAFDMLTNLLGKFQKTIDGIVSNLR